MTEERWTADDAQCEVIRENMHSFNERNNMKKRIVIVMDGGLIQHILGNTEDIEIALVDYDVEGAEEERLTNIPQEDGKLEQAFCWTMTGPDEVNAQRVNELFTVINGTREKSA